MVSADDTTVDDVNITIPIACTLSSTSNTAHTATIEPGIYEDDIGTTTLKAICNDANGFAIYAAGYTGNVVGDTNSTKLIGANTNQLISTGIGTSGDSQWAMKLATDSTATYPITIESAPNTSGGTDASFADYHIVPTDYTKVATRLAATDAGTSATGSILTTTYAVNIASTQAADTYTGKVIYTLVHPNDAPIPVDPLLETDCPANTICYAPNTNDIDGSMESISSTKITKSPTAGVQTQTYNSVSSLGNITSNSNVRLIAPNYSRSGYGFAGWSTDYNATNSSIIYGPNQTITTATDGTGDADVSEHGLILYPVWVASVGSIQNWAGCSALTQANYDSETGVLSATLSSVTALTDQRDSETYTVARLADGNCWMIENLRLDAEDTLGDANKALAQGYGISTTYGNFIGLPNSEDANFDGASPPVANNLYSADGSNNTININTFNSGARIPRYNNNNTNRELASSYAGTGSTIYYQWYSYGNYYNWSATMANTIGYGSPTSTDANGKTSETVGTSICPSGWKLPYGGNTSSGATLGSMAYLDTLMGGDGEDHMQNTIGITQSKTWRSFPNNIIASGYFSDSSAQSRGTFSHYWTSTSWSTGGARSFSLGGNSINPGGSNLGKHLGYSVRCLIGS